MNATKRRLTDDEFFEVISELWAWKDRDRMRSIKYARLLRESERRRKIRRIFGISVGVLLLVILVVLLVW